MVVVCTPCYRMHNGLVPDYFCLDYVTLLDDLRHGHDGLYPRWDKWLKLNGIKENPSRRITLADSSTVIHAAMAGQGIDLASLRPDQHELATGRLIVTYGISLSTRDAYFFVDFDAAAYSSSVQVFRWWLLHETATVRTRSSAPVRLQDLSVSIAAG